MTILEFVLFLAVAGIVGCIGQALAGYSSRGCLVSVALGFIGALLGTWLARLLALPDFLVIRFGSQAFPVVWSILGAALCVGVLGALSRSRRRPPPP
jgi:uncharacterized membrane protein YeaQ/YmgE (transglycosylase-associated protein family)